MHTGGQQIPGEFKRRDGLLTLHGRKVVEELVQRISGGQIIEEVLHRHACTPKHGGAAEQRRRAAFGPGDIRRGIVIMTILGPCRALEPEATPETRA
jgi:hypothetical protein